VLNQRIQQEWNEISIEQMHDSRWLLGKRLSHWKWKRTCYEPNRKRHEQQVACLQLPPPNATKPKVVGNLCEKKDQPKSIQRPSQSQAVKPEKVRRERAGDYQENSAAQRKIMVPQNGK
jgi:hypothetical protein